MSQFDDRVRIVPEFHPEEHDRYRETLFGRLERRLSRWKPEQVELELSVKDRDSNSQKVVLECWISGVPKIVGTSKNTDLDSGVIEVRDDVWRQIDKFVTKKETARKR